MLVQFVIAAVLTAAAPLAAFAQLQQGTIAGTVLDSDGRPVAGVAITLLDELGRPVTAVEAGGTGEYRFANVAPGTYAVSADRPPLRALVEGVHIAGALPVTVDLRLSAVLAEQITVRAEEPAS